MLENRHSILIKCGEKEALCEIIRWGEASWWPKNSLMRFARQDTSAVKKGTRYQQRVLLPFAPSWGVEVQDLTDNSITRRFLDGMFAGSETVSLKKSWEGIEVSYAMNYQINGLINRILWPLFFERLHNSNIRAILSNLKAFLEKG